MSKKMTGQLSFFDQGNRMKKVDEFDRLPEIKRLVSWESFRKMLTAATRSRNSEQGGRPGYDVVKMFRILVLQRLYNLSDDALEFRLNDSFSFQRFVGIGGDEPVPDAKTIWLYREQLSKSGSMPQLFLSFNKQLNEQGFMAEGGTIVDAMVVEVPRKKVSQEDYKEVKEGKIPEGWDGGECQMRQLDRDARFTRKGGEYLYGYKNHISVDVKHKLIRRCEVTAACTHESQVVGKLITTENSSNVFFADSAYDTHAVRSAVAQHGLRAEIQRQRRHPSMPVNKFSKYNYRIRHTRKRVEHVFGHQVTSMKAALIRCVGKVRADTIICLNNLVYNMSRLRFLATP